MESKGRVGAPPKEKEKAITKERHPREKQKQKLGDSYLDLGEQGFKSPGSLHMEKDMEDILAQNRVTQEDIDALELPEGNPQLSFKLSLMSCGSIALDEPSTEPQ